jgi:hypothetical protein
VIVARILPVKSTLQGEIVTREDMSPEAAEASLPISDNFLKNELEAA